MSPKAARVVALLLRNLGKTSNYDKDQSSATNTKAKLLQEGIFFLIHLFARDILLIKKVGNRRN